jgi:hypothetical protein
MLGFMSVTALIPSINQSSAYRKMAHVCRSGDDGLQTPAMSGQGSERGQYKFHFNIGSIDSFERKMEEAQEDLGWASDSFVPITYTNELSWQQVRCL